MTYEQTMAHMRDWLNEHCPVKESTQFHLAPNNMRNKMLTDKVNKFREKARIVQRWRVDLSNRLRLDGDEIVRAINTILEMIDGELAKGGTVRLTDFGDFKLADKTYKGLTLKTVCFYADEYWKRELNAPLYQDELGFKHSLHKGRLARRKV